MNVPPNEGRQVMAGTYPVPFTRDTYWSELFDRLCKEPPRVFSEEDVLVMFDSVVALGTFISELEAPGRVER